MAGPTNYLYAPGSAPQEYMLLQWMERMRTDGELDKTLSKGVHSPTTFLTFFTTRPLMFRVDSLGNLTHAAWFEAVMGSAFLGYYISPKGREQSNEKVFFLYDALGAAFDYGVNSVCGWIQERPTEDETDKFIRLHVRLGYTYTGYLPKFFDGKDCHIVGITREEWEALDGKWKRLWKESRNDNG